jgi:hypothetical protein
MPFRIALVFPLVGLVAVAAPTPRADDADVRAVLAELALPPLRPGVPDPVPADFRRELDPAAMRERTPDLTLTAVEKNREKYPARAATLDALAAVRKRWPGGPAADARYRETVPAAVTDSVRKAVLDDQEWPALALAELEDAVRDLDRAAPHAAADAPRWRAHHAYVSAHLRLRMAFVMEYNLALGLARRENLPELNSGVDVGWRLVPAAELQSKQDARRLLADAHKRLDAVARDHKGTPWAALAQRDRELWVGLKWEPDGQK